MKRKFIWWLGFVTLFVLFSVTAYGQWPTYHGNYARTGASPASIDPNTLTLGWFFQPGVGNPLVAGFPNGTGIPILNGGQSAIIGFGKVFYGYNDVSDQDVVVALDATTGAYLWHKVIRLPGLGGGFVHVPTVALRDTGGPAPDTAVYVYGTNNSVWALNANTGAVLWNRTGINNAAASLNSGAPIVFDTTLIIHDNGSAGAGRRFVSALSTRNGSTVWTSAAMLFRIFLGPSLSNDTLYVSGRGSGISGDGGGQFVAINANTGATIATYDPADPYNWQHSPVVFEDVVVGVSRNDVIGGSFSGTVHRLSHDLATVVTGPGAPPSLTSIGFTRFHTPELYVEPSVGEKIVVYGTAGLSADVPPGAIVMRRILPSISLRSYQLLVGQIHGPGAVAAGNGLLLQGDDAGYWWAMDANSYGGAFFGGLYPYWLKQFPSHITAGAAISPDDDTLVVIIDGNGNAAGWRNGVVTTRPRAQIFFDYLDPNFSGGNLGLARSELTLGIVPTDTLTGTGGFANIQLGVFQNVGNDVLTYSLDHGSSPVVLSAADFGGAINMSRVHPTRNKMARELVEENTVTSGNAFLEKKYVIGSKSIKDAMDMEEDGITSLKDIRDLNSKATYFGTTKLEEAKKTLANPGWLFVNDENAGVAAAGDSITLDIVAINPNVGYGEFFGEIKLHSTNEPDVQGNPLDTTRITVKLLVGWLPERADVSAAACTLSKTNYGRDVAYLGDLAGYSFNGDHQGFDAWIVVGNSETTFSGVDGTYDTDAGDQAVSGYGPEDVFNLELRTNLTDDGPFADAVTYEFHNTKYTHTNGLPLKIVQCAWAIQSDLAGATYEGDAVYQTLAIINTSGDSVKGIEVGLTADNDIIPSATNNQSAVDPQHDNVYQWETSNPDLVFGYFRIPRDNVNTPGSDVLRGTITRGVTGATEYYGNGPEKADTLQAWWDNQEKSILGPVNDVWITNGSAKFDLGPGEFKTISFVWYGADLSSGASLVDRLKEWCLLAGYYRGDVNGAHWSGTPITLSDVQYLSNYVSYGGPAPVPFTSQGDVNGDDAVDAADISYLYDYVSTNGATAAPIDRDRFVPTDYGPGNADWSNRATGRPSLNDDTNWTP
ncbi:MAG: hypothetical protein RBG1_1C00001G0586 [candidate division Zixibacteria bacterium RBG-1]|nr:MAG: hypothetical protein RBG1_1C00001G0586 [candidate division Zixibacteria bacterium RBG-1]OGC85078.1 MAG: hypothetical protein A2V73_03060 [candidate division Zixibacteria bacterium RBG_19FT_COMBO_42_43]